MKIEEVRASFTVYLVASDPDRLTGVGEPLGKAGYMVASFNELTAAFSEFPSNPPHFLVFDAGETRFNLKKAVKQVSAQLPESHIFLLTPVEAREAVVPLLDQGAYDLIYAPIISPVELVRSLDRAAERDYFMYMAERLSETASGTAKAPVATPSSAENPPEEGPQMAYARRLFEKKTGDDCLQVFLTFGSEVLGGCAAVFLRYIANRRVLVAAQSVRLDPTEVGGLGVDFNRGAGDFKMSQLRDPMSIRELQSMVSEVFGVTEYFACPVDALDESWGIALFLRPPPKSPLLEVISNWNMLLSRAISLLEAEKRLHVTNIKDVVTDFFNRAHFITRIQHEVARARRTNTPTSLLLVAVDQFGQIVSQMGKDEANTILRMIARIVEKHSRVNDVLGRTGMDEFGVLLPHTSKRGASIKAERLRRILESADFSKVIKDFPRVTVSIGVSEYPSLVRDAEELHHAADEALYQVRRLGNRTCLSQPPDGFTPDFEVREKGAV